jgi:hypothetical protein
MNTYLKVKIKSLAEEARIIRREEWQIKSKPVGYRESGWSAKLDGLHNHRTQVVRPEARATQLAYGFLRGRLYSQIEAKASTEPSWDRVAAMVRKYGSIPWAQRDAIPELLKQWKKNQLPPLKKAS